MNAKIDLKQGNNLKLHDIMWWLYNAEDYFHKEDNVFISPNFLKVSARVAKICWPLCVTQTSKRSLSLAHKFSVFLLHCFLTLHFMFSTFNTFLVCWKYNTITASGGPMSCRNESRCCHVHVSPWKKPPPPSSPICNRALIYTGLCVYNK